MQSRICVSAILFLAFGRAFAFGLNAAANSSGAIWTQREVQIVSETSQCPLGFRIDEILGEAIMLWNTSPGNPVRIVHLKDAVQAKGRATVVCEANFEMVTGSSPDRVPAASTIHTRGSEILEAKLLLNTSMGKAHISVYDSTTLKVAVAHEIGHILGLGHSQDRSALMYFDATGKRALKLANDDVQGLRSLYPLFAGGAGKLRLQSSFDLASFKRDFHQFFDELRIRIARNVHHLGIHADRSETR